MLRHNDAPAKKTNRVADDNNSSVITTKGDARAQKPRQSSKLNAQDGQLAKSSSSIGLARYDNIQAQSMNTSRAIKSSFYAGKVEQVLETYRKPAQTGKRDFIEENKRNVSQKGKSNPKPSKTTYSKQKCETRRTSNTAAQVYKSPNSNSKAGNQAADRLSQSRYSNKSPAGKVKLSETARSNMGALNAANHM